MANELLIIHEYGAPEHYTGAKAAFSGTIKYRAFSTFLLIAKGIKNKSAQTSLTAIRDFFYLLTIWMFPALIKHDQVILGCAPLDWRIIFFRRMFKYSKVTYHSSWLVWGGSKFPKQPLFKSFFLKQWKAFLQNQVQHHAVVTPEVKQQICLYMGVDQAKVSVVYHSVDETIFNAAQPKVMQPIRAVFVGRLIEEKGIANILRLAKALPQIEFCIVGKGRLEQAITEVQATHPNIKFKGYVSKRTELAEIYRGAHFIFQPSLKTKTWEELFGMAIIEAMACGVIPVTTDHVGPCTILADTALADNLLAEDDFDFKAQHILEQALLEDNAEKLQLLSIECQKLAAQYSLTSIAGRWQRILKV